MRTIRRTGLAAAVLLCSLLLAVCRLGGTDPAGCLPDPPAVSLSPTDTIAVASSGERIDTAAADSPVPTEPTGTGGQPADTTDPPAPTEPTDTSGQPVDTTKRPADTSGIAGTSGTTGASGTTDTSTAAGTVVSTVGTDHHHQLTDETLSLQKNGNAYDLLITGTCSVCHQTGLFLRSARIAPGVIEDGEASLPAAVGKGGTITASQNEDGSLSLEARPDDFFVFVRWSDGVDTPKRRYTGTEDLYALFGYETHTMPVISIQTQDAQQVTHRDYYLPCLVSVTNCPDKQGLTQAAASIRVRGNTSCNYGDPEYARTHKVHYRLKFDKKTSLLGLNGGARCKSWVLLRGDKNFLHEALSFKLYRGITQGAYYVSDYTYVQIYINYEYYGAYLLCEQTQIQENRISIHEKAEGDTGLRTGYLVEIDQYYRDEPYRFVNDFGGVELTDMYGVTRAARPVGHSVKYDDMTPEQLQYISRYVQNVYTVVYRAIYEEEYYKLDGDQNLIPAPEFGSARECVENVLDLEAAAAMYITREVAAERDGGIGSFFMSVDFLDAHPRLTFCAPWDFSWAFDSSDGFRTDHLWVAAFQPPEFAYAGDHSFTWFITLYQADFFRSLVNSLWEDMHARGVQDSLLREIERVTNTYAPEFQMNQRRWEAVDQAAAAEVTRRFLAARMAWLDTQWLPQNGEGT